MGGGARLALAAARLAEAVAAELARAGCDCILLSGGVDTTFIVAADRAHHNVLETAVTVTSPGAPDLGYARLAASMLGLRHVVVDPASSLNAFWASAARAALALETVDPVEVAAGAVLVAGLESAKADGCECVATGDGGDELFLGYTFLHSLPPRNIEEWLARMQAGGARFPSPRLARETGVRVTLPLYTEEARRVSASLTPPELLGPEPPGAPPGKAPLRLYLHLRGLDVIAYRPKEPVTSGSGALALLECAARSRPRSAQKWPPTWLHSVLQRVHDDAETGLPRPCPLAGERCPVCGSCLTAGHCQYCGAYTAGGRVSVYRPPPPSRVACPG